MMGRLRWHLLLLVFLIPVFSAFALGDDWLPITPEELQMKDFAAAPGAAAVQLYYSESRDDEHNSRSGYRRIKVLNEKGKSYADVTIEIQPFQHLSYIKARTIHPDGSIIEFKGQTFEKTIVKTRDEKYLARTFTMPDVTVGSIIEYKYEIDWDPNIVWDGAFWELQHELYTVKEHFEQRATSKFFYYDGLTKHMGDSLVLSYEYSQVKSDVKPKKSGNLVTLDLENIPAFQSEEFMPPAENFKPEVRFFYGGRELTSSEGFWRDYGQEWYSQAKHFIGHSSEVKKAAAEAVSGETKAQKKLFRLYARAQKIRNLSFERSRNKEEKKKENLKKNDNAEDVLKRGYGTHNDITGLFVALARAAGFDADIVRAASRNRRFFDRKLLVARQLDTDIAVVKLNGNLVYLDPGTRFCPFGVVRWENASVAAMELDKSGGTFVTVSTGTAGQAVVRRVTKGKITPEGDLEGDLMVEFRGQEALEHRLNAIDTDEAGRRKDLEEELQTIMPNGAVLHMKDSHGWDQTEQPLVANLSIRVPSFASVVGKRIIVPATLFKTRTQTAFQSQKRKYPVYFHYAYEELDNLILRLPDGYTVENMPPAQNTSTKSTRFITALSFANNQFVSKRALVVNSIIFPAEDYAEVKKFFGQVRDADGQQAVLHRSAVNARKE